MDLFASDVPVGVYIDTSRSIAVQHPCRFANIGVSLLFLNRTIISMSIVVCEVREWRNLSSANSRLLRTKPVRDDTEYGNLFLCIQDRRLQNTRRRNKVYRQLCPCVGMCFAEEWKSENTGAENCVFCMRHQCAYSKSALARHEPCFVYMCKIDVVQLVFEWGRKVMEKVYALQWRAESDEWRGGSV